MSSLRQRIKDRAAAAGSEALGTLYRVAKRLPIVRRQIERGYEEMLDKLRESVRPYRGELEGRAALPEEGLGRDAILEQMKALSQREEARWRDGFVSGAVYHGDGDHIDFLSEVYRLNSQANPLHADLWPSTSKYEAEIVAMTARMLGAEKVQTEKSGDDAICGCVTSGGTESIILAVKAHRDWARAEKGISRPQVVAPVTAHAAFDKAAQLFDIELTRVPVDDDMRADVAAMKRAVTSNTALIVASTPSFPHGVIDPVEELASFAARKGVGMHVDACLGGFVLPWAERLGYPVPPFDFRVPGVTSMSADTHKYGYALKGTSVVLYRGLALRRYQYYTVEDWPGGLYFSPTLAGSRPGALSAVCWAAMVSMGEKGYLEATRRILATADVIREGIGKIPGLRVLGDPLWVIAFEAAGLDVYRVMDAMTARGWSLNGLHRPRCVHLCVTLRHAQLGVAERFLDDLRAAVDEVRAQPRKKGGMAPIYGLAASVPFRGAVGDLLSRYIDLLYEV